MEREWETCWQRACKDTEHFRKSGWSFWAWGVVGAAVFGVVGAFVGYWLTPSNFNPFWQFAYPTIGGGIGVVVGFVLVFSLILGWNLYRAPYRQRDEARGILQARPKPIPLPNSKELKEAIALVENKTILLVSQLDVYEKMRGQSNYTVNSDMENDKNTAYALWNEAMNELRVQYLVAGERYESICIELTGFIWMQVAAKMEFFKPPEGNKPLVLKDRLQFVGEIANRVKKALRGIDEISGLVPDKKGSQIE